MPGIMDARQGKGFINMNKLILFFLAIALFFSCSKDNSTNNTDFFTPVYVNLDINTALPDYNDLRQVQGWVYIKNVGNRGIVVYHTINDDYVAFDRTCPVNPTKDCAFISVDSSITFFKCAPFPNSEKTCTDSSGFCYSRFDASSGAPINGAAKQALRQYYVQKQVNGVYVNLHITSTP